MLFEYTRRRGVRSPVTDAPTFRVGKLARAKTADQTGVDVSDLIDRQDVRTRIEALLAG
jgi:hypothetical protein